MAIVVTGTIGVAASIVGSEPGALKKAMDDLGNGPIGFIFQIIAAGIMSLVLFYLAHRELAETLRAVYLGVVIGNWLKRAIIWAVKRTRPAADAVDSCAVEGAQFVRDDLLRLARAKIKYAEQTGDWSDVTDLDVALAGGRS